MAVFTVQNQDPSRMQEAALAALHAKLAITYGLARKGDPDALARLGTIRAAAAQGDGRAQAAWRAVGALHNEAEKNRARWQAAYAMAKGVAQGDPRQTSLAAKVVKKAALGDERASATAARIGSAYRDMAEEHGGAFAVFGSAYARMAQADGGTLAVGRSSYARMAEGGPMLVVGKSLSPTERAELHSLIQRAIDSIPNWKLFIQSGLGTAQGAGGSPKAGSFADAYLTDKGAVSNYTKADGTINRNALMIMKGF